MNFAKNGNVSRFIVKNVNPIKITHEAIEKVILPRAQNFFIELQKKWQQHRQQHRQRQKEYVMQSTVKIPKMVMPHCNVNIISKQQQYEKDQNSKNSNQQNATNDIALIGFASFFSFFSKSEEEEETPEDKLINTIKRSMLCIQREQYDKAEQMLHLALRMAQDIQSKEGITYIFDVMANLAMEREQFKKAENLFVDVMKRLFADGYSDESPQILHISVKLAHMAQLQGELDKSMQGFQWTLKKIQNSIQKMPGDKEIVELLGLTKNWYGQLLMKQGKYTEAKKAFIEAYDCLVEIYGKENKEAITILNNLSVACVNMDNLDDAERYLLQALELVRETKDTAQEGVIQANLGLIYLQEGLLAQAKEYCSTAYRVGKKNKNADAVEQAEYCLNEIKAYTKHRETSAN